MQWIRDGTGQDAKTRRANSDISGNQAPLTRETTRQSTIVQPITRMKDQLPHASRNSPKTMSQEQQKVKGCVKLRTY